METFNYNDNRQATEIKRIPFDFVYGLNKQTRDDRNKIIGADTKTGEVFFAQVPRYDNPSLRLRLIRTRKTQEDLVIFEAEWRETETGNYIDNFDKPLFSRKVCMPHDLKLLWPDYSETMSREALNALPLIPVKEAHCVAGFYVHSHPKTDANGEPVLDAKGKPVMVIECDLNGNPIIDKSTKWETITLLDGSIFEPSGDKRKFDAPATVESKEEPKSEPKSEETNNEEGDE